ncbi:multiprotein-bridging factor 1 family protein [Azospirillum doebereinerae]|uniref:Helix-turn-helix domain-containing protein n=2 Tax=Azospirillum doebereinerae TaxID=92933 RepID=A0A3S0WLZ3_9PROT|nr:helix-turn-helix domain-containing protein [Azospirillum doebereinerae]RUQ70865.1 helix-turn-helix domain-containing protein [Azospirillum doebereinerae]
MITPRQTRAARAMLGWSRQDLADRALVSLSTVRRIEEAGSDVRVSSLKSVRKTLEAAGVEFSNRDDDGVRMKP